MFALPRILPLESQRAVDDEQDVSVGLKAERVGCSATYGQGSVLQQRLESESYDTQRGPLGGSGDGGVAVETLPLSGLGSFVAVKAYY